MCSKASQSALSLASAADREEAEEIAKKKKIIIKKSLAVQSRKASKPK